jgi:hypothetical protein
MRTTFASIVVALTVSTSASAADVTFAFDDARLLRDNEKESGLAHAYQAGQEAPLVVFLHGVNDGGLLHRGFGSGTFDVRTIIDELIDDDLIDPPIVAGPSQTRDAWSGAKMWNDFDLAAFVDATERASGTKIDRGRVILVGHSGSGCNPAGGLLSPMTNFKPMAIVALDTCMDERFGKLWLNAASISPVHIAYQDLIWPREFAAFKAVIDGTKGKPITIGRYNAPTLNPHEEVVRLGLRSALPKWLPPPPPEEPED